MDESQKMAEVNAAKEIFTTWVRRYGVHSDYPADEFAPSEFDAQKVWTEVWDDGGMILAGYQAPSDNLKFPVIGYYVSEKPFDSEHGNFINVSTSLLFPCKDCGYEINFECDGCGGEGDFFEFPIAE